MCGCLSHAPCWGPGLQPRHVLSWGIEPGTLWFEAHAQSAEPQLPGLHVSLNNKITFKNANKAYILYL